MSKKHTFKYQTNYPSGQCISDADISDAIGEAIKAAEADFRSRGIEIPCLESVNVAVERCNPFMDCVVPCNRFSIGGTPRVESFYPKFKVGDRVTATGNDEDNRVNITNLSGVVIRQLRREVNGQNVNYYVVQFDNYMGGHDGGIDEKTGKGIGKTGYCWITNDYNTVLEVPSLLAKKGGMSQLSTLAKRYFDADSKALVEIGVLDSALELADPRLALEMLVAIFTKELAVEAKARLKEIKAEAKR